MRLTHYLTEETGALPSEYEFSSSIVSGAYAYTVRDQVNVPIRIIPPSCQFRSPMELRYAGERFMCGENWWRLTKTLPKYIRRILVSRRVMDNNHAIWVDGV